MSAVVLKFPAAKPAPKLTDGPRMSCLNCDGATFMIQPDGGIFCIGCSARIRNLKAVKP